MNYRSHRVFFREKGQGTPTVLLHGFPDHSGNLLKLYEGLAKSQQVLAFDRLGSGQSDKPDLPYSLDFFVEELAALTRDKGFESMVLVGHSIGGTVATAFAAKYPERVKALVLMNPALCDFHIQTGMDYLGAWFLKWPFIGEMMLFFHNRMATRLSLALAFYNKKRMTDEMVESYYFPFVDKGGKRSYLTAMRSIYGITDAAVEAQIAEVAAKQIPVQLVWSERDWSMPLADGRRFERLFKAQMQTVPECGHSPHLELEDDAFERLVMEPVRRFLSAF